jgi:predicted RNA binding protein YcfA (HicA-like mRNA interferase family)
MKQKLSQLRSGKEFVHYAETHGAEVRNGKGSHAIVHTAKGQTVVPQHNNDLGIGLRMKLVKTFIAIGLTLLKTFIVIGLAVMIVHIFLGV